MPLQWNKLCRPLLDLLYPRNCCGCGKGSPDAAFTLCWDCLADITWIQPPYCAVCGNPVSGSIEHSYTCSQCVSHRPWFDAAFSCGRYEGLLRNMVLSLKYYGALWLARDLSLLLSLAFHNRFADIEVDIMMPVPLHRRKFRERGFNQAWSLVQGLARRLDIPATDHCLLRSRYTATQTNLTVTQRAANVKRAFDARWPEWLEGRRVLLVDDVMTTGATMNACARALKENGAARVYALTAARGVN